VSVFSFSLACLRREFASSGWDHEACIILAEFTICDRGGRLISPSVSAITKGALSLARYGVVMLLESPTAKANSSQPTKSSDGNRAEKETLVTFHNPQLDAIRKRMN
jgi:hypothetical protein